MRLTRVLVVCCLASYHVDCLHWALSWQLHPYSTASSSLHQPRPVRPPAVGSRPTRSAWPGWHREPLPGRRADSAAAEAPRGAPRQGAPLGRNPGARGLARRGGSPCRLLRDPPSPATGNTAHLGVSGRPGYPCTQRDVPSSTSTPSFSRPPSGLAYCKLRLMAPLSGAPEVLSKGLGASHRPAHQLCSDGCETLALEAPEIEVRGPAASARPPSPMHSCLLMMRSAGALPRRGLQTGEHPGACGDMWMLEPMSSASIWDPTWYTIVSCQLAQWAPVTPSWRLSQYCNYHERCVRCVAGMTA